MVEDWDREGSGESISPRQRIERHWLLAHIVQTMTTHRTAKQAGKSEEVLEQASWKKEM